MMRPVLAEFDPSTVTPLKMLRSMPADLRGVVTNLHDALKELRSTVFRAGQLVLADGQVATQAWLEGDVLARTLPSILQSGFMARDDEGALFSPHLYAKLLRKEEREARKALADAQWEQLQESGEVPEGMSRKVVTARQNGGAGGRPRKGESAEQARARRTREMEQQQAQRHMPLVATVAGGKPADENPNKKPNGFSVSENSVSPVSIDLELERDTYTPSGSISGETEKPETKLDDALVRRIAARMVSVSGMSDQVSFAISFARRWMGLGATEETIISAIQKHQAAIRNNGEEPRRLKVFEDEVLRGIEAQQVMEAMSSAPPENAHKTEDMCQLEDAWGRATQVWKKAFADCRDYGAVTRQWPDLAQEHGLPDVPYDRAAYQQFFSCTEAVAA
ncbi:hypothetical protein NKW44_14715 [Acetobacter lovaniensis]|jgi:hypothetical protein|uniref:hypothetical protein n=1 Tax=Acetobacter lovaniensis TaxID=104100 RepID=UPI00209EFC1D|nr:hypothetical protein [Acetobacter lovaniensis]MCI1796582.1 hypothetical protein [Acetobacter lovaniensis]MCP1240912.1 hypothetical protein [Acetobacter lovaniensis]